MEFEITLHDQPLQLVSPARGPVITRAGKSKAETFGNIWRASGDCLPVCLREPFDALKTGNLGGGVFIGFGNRLTEHLSCTLSWGYLVRANMCCNLAGLQRGSPTVGEAPGAWKPWQGSGTGGRSPASRDCGSSPAHSKTAQ